ncbi:hypothetical protein QU617_15750 [Pseudomonas guariconensis]|uniref:hypothetical protein n=1 Tax=Pseudomonas guariconensis TaxID=1288410 RepID=UPI0025A96BDC|nr:hypothetical protein [Pseudomonas guariconensis]MDM9594762.1 hypothetical protein [Pseudomonas guariconensis]MDM9607593.1 hypothetical protein [Pseudomonas guariconensis]MDM9612550.1 hypothetical protein [Pseudomonas guariconensis]MEB3843518.1 hypothetical protein [Pseudomonas guariconensis]MEB3876386.1 hypothetical protein [Pseudomonas guariconensis]
MKYQSVLAAVVRALAAETMSGVGGGDFEPKVQASKLKGEISGKDAAMLVDCWVHARLHSKLIPRHWNALTARFSTHKAKKVDAIGKLVPLIATQAPNLFRYKAVTAWAIPPVKGVQAHSGHEVASRAARERAEFDSLHAGVVQRLAGGEMPEDAGQARREQYVKRSTDMIVLPAEFYDINTWDGQGLNRTTYWRWKKAIEKVLDEMVAEALIASGKILQEEGVLMADAA